MSMLKNKSKKIISVGGALILSFVSSTNVLAYSDATTYGETSMYFADYDADTGTYTNKMSEVISGDRKSTRLNSSHANISYAVFCLKKKTLSPPQTSTVS